MNTKISCTTIVISAAIIAIASGYNPTTESEVHPNRVSSGKVTMNNVVTEFKTGKPGKRRVVRQVPKVDFKVVKTDKVVSLSRKDRNCLVMNAYHEAGVEGHMGMLAVLQVTQARVASGRWGSTPCEVVYRKAQFSWTLEKEKVKSKPDGPLWAAANKAVDAFAGGERVKGLGNALFYHTDYIATPKWAANDHMIGSIGRHIFYTRDIKKHEV